MDFAKRNAEAAQILARQLVETKEERNAIIEECALVAEDWGCHKDAVAAIRALKDKHG